MRLFLIQKNLLSYLVWITENGTQITKKIELEKYSNK